jgi:protein-S-isoprenylcysteine O-methyltransferase Ste14
MALPRAILAFLALPGVVAYLVPVLWGSDGDLEARWFQWVGLGVVVGGTALLLSCVREFYVQGKGTLAPWSPPRTLVTTGVYRLSRNPMYVAVVVVLLGWAAWFASPGLLAYAAAILLAFHVRVVFVEEPQLERSFGDEWRRYSRRVHRWLSR